MEAENLAAATTPKLFSRQATGLVRSVPQRTALVFNFIPSHPAFVLSAGVFFAFSLFPGGNFFLALLIDIPVVLAFAYSYGLLSSMLPRTGGDYMFVTRVLHPAVGVVSSTCWMVALFLSNAFFATAFIKVGLAPGLSVIGLVGKSPTFVSWGSTLATNTTSQFVVGTIMLLLAASIMAAGWRLTLRLQAIVFGITIVGLLICAVIALFTSHAAFVQNFNHFAQPYTHQGDTYDSVISTASKSGVVVHPPFSIGNTVPLLGVLAIATIFPFISAAYSGEIRQAHSTRTANTMGLAGILSIIGIAIFGVIFLHTFGTAFVTAANSATGLPSSIAASPTYFFLLSASVGNSVLAGILVFTYAIYWPLNTYCNFMQQSRIIFAWAFDGLLPESATKVSRQHSPFVALIATVVISIVALLWSLHSATFLTVIVYGTVLAVVAMMLVGVSATVVPWRRPDYYRGGATQARLLGIPVVSIAGAASVLAGLFVCWLYLHYPEFGVASGANMFEWIGGVVVVALAFYYLVRWILRARKGLRLELVYAEIPPE